MEIRRVNILLVPTKEQRQSFYDSVYYSQRMYNQAIDWCKEAYEETGMFLSKFDMINMLPDFKQENSEYYKVDGYVLKDAVTQLRKALNNRNRGAGFPRYKSYSKSRKSFGVRTERVTLQHNKVKIPSIGWVKCKHCHWLTKDESDEQLSMLKLHDTRIYFDNKYWYLSVGIEISLTEDDLTNEVIGIDLGIKNHISSSNGVVEPNINHSRQIKLLERRKKILQRRISRKYELNKVGRKYIKTNNIKREEYKLQLIYRKLTNLRENNLQRICNKIISFKPKRIMLEDLNVKGMMKNKHLSRAIQEQLFYRTRQLLTEKAKNCFIEVGIIPRMYKSSKLCSRCGVVKKDLKLSDRIYKCPNCGLTIDRDFNASINIRDCKDYRLV